MNVLEPTITCLMTVHMKPTVREAIISVLKQTRRDYELIVIDSGQWVWDKGPVADAMREAYLDFKDAPQVSWYFTGERQGFKDVKCPVAHWTNMAFKSDLIRGKYLCTFYDDDLYYPWFFDQMAGYLDEHEEDDAVRCSEQWVSVDKNGRHTKLRVLEADRPLLPTDTFDEVVDGMQVMLRTDVVKKLEQPIIPDDPLTCRHSDGLFFERFKTVMTRMGNIPVILCEHRFTPHSTYTPST